jgi:hypothetical protein
VLADTDWKDCKTVHSNMTALLLILARLKE